MVLRNRCARVYDYTGSLLKACPGHPSIPGRGAGIAGHHGHVGGCLTRDHVTIAPNDSESSPTSTHGARPLGSRSASRIR
jgi:hypothetical protein